MVSRKWFLGSSFYKINENRNNFPNTFPMKPFWGLSLPGNRKHPNHLGMHYFFYPRPLHPPPVVIIIGALCGAGKPLVHVAARVLGLLARLVLPVFSCDNVRHDALAKLVNVLQVSNDLGVLAVIVFVVSD